MTPTPAPGFRIERCGNLYVYIPIRPTVHTTSKAFAVMCA